MPGHVVRQKVELSAVAAPIAVLTPRQNTLQVVELSPAFVALLAESTEVASLVIPSSALLADPARVESALSELDRGATEASLELRLGPNHQTHRLLLRRAGDLLVGTLELPPSDWRFEQIVQKSPDIIAMIDRQFRHAFVNAAIGPATGLTPADFEGKDHRELGIDDAMVDYFQGVYREVFATGIEGSKEFEFPAPDGQSRTYSSRVVPLVGPDGRCDVLLSCARDVTERKRAEEARLAMELKMRESQRLESLGLLAGGVAHDFNNLLTAILGMASVARAHSAPNGLAYRSLSGIESACESAAGLCAQMLAYAGRGRTPDEPVQLSGLVQSTADLVRASAPKNIQLGLHFAEELPAVIADRSQLQQVVLNLLINAVEAIPDGQGRVDVSVRCTEASEIDWRHAVAVPDAPQGTFLALEVRDSGVGMDADTLARMFDPFFTTKFTGRGLGLAASLGIIRSHQGGLVVRSAPGTGSTFALYLPAAGEHARVDALNDLSHASALPAHVLVVDDERQVREAMVWMLEAEGHRVTAAASGHEAIDLCQSTIFDVVLLDLTMPGLDGYETLSRLRALCPNLPVAVMSGYTEGDFRRDSSTRVGQPFLQKPFRVEALNALIQSLLLGRSSPSLEHPSAE